MTIHSAHQASKSTHKYESAPLHAAEVKQTFTQKILKYLCCMDDTSVRVAPFTATPVNQTTSVYDEAYREATRCMRD